MKMLEKWVWLAEKFQNASYKTDELLDVYGTPEAIFERDDYRECKYLSKADVIKLNHKSLDAAKAIIERCSKKGYSILTQHDEDFPVRLRDIPASPIVLYIDGTLPNVDRIPSFAIVGTRNVTPYGAKIATAFGSGVAQAGGIVTSGMAIGVDTFAHKGALKANGKTIAVLGCGLDIAYPKSNAELKEIIASNGCVISEYPPMTGPTRHAFPIRNRIISGLSEATIVVEAGIRSGSLITANHAAEQGRQIYAIPGNIDSPQSAGPNRLILDGAHPLVSVKQLIGENVYNYPDALNMRALKNTELLVDAKPTEEELLSEVKSHQRAVNEQRALEFEENKNKLPQEMPELNEIEKAIYELVLQAPKKLGDLARLINQPVYKVVTAASSLELKKLIELQPTGYFIKKD